MAALTLSPALRAASGIFGAGTIIGGALIFSGIVTDTKASVCASDVVLAALGCVMGAFLFEMALYPGAHFIIDDDDE